MVVTSRPKYSTVIFEVGSSVITDIYQLEHVFISSPELKVQGELLVSDF